MRVRASRGELARTRARLAPYPVVANPSGPASTVSDGCRGKKAAHPRTSVWWCLIVPVLLLSLGRRAQAQVDSGSYTGDGSASRPIVIGFQPDAVFVKGVSGFVGWPTQMCTSSMASDQTKPMTGSLALQPDRIRSLDANGFTIGSDASVNQSGGSYWWVAFKADADLKIGSYLGDGTNNRPVTGVGFQPAYLIVASESSDLAVHRSTSMTKTFYFDVTAPFNGGINSLDIDGFTVGNRATVNAAGITYHYLAWRKTAGKMNEGSYTGNSLDNRNITGVGFQPEWVIVQSSGIRPVHHPASLGVSTDSSLDFSTGFNPPPNQTKRCKPTASRWGTIAPLT